MTRSAAPIPPATGASEMAREVPTSEAARIVGVKPDVLRKWKARGFLKLAPHGVSGQGRGLECMWSAEAISEAKAWSEKRRPGRKRASLSDRKESKDGR